MQQIVEQGTLAHVDGIPEDIRRVFVCAHDVSPIWHVKMQAAFQEYTDNAVSQDGELPQFRHPGRRSPRSTAWPMTLGCKGTTIYRDGSRNEQVLNIGKVNDGKPAESGSAPLPDHVEKLLESDCRLHRMSLRNGSIMPRPRPDGDHRLHREGEDRLRQPVYHRQLRRERHLRGLYQHRRGQAAAPASPRPPPGS